MTNIEHLLIGKRIDLGSGRTGQVVTWAETGLFYRNKADDGLQFIPWQKVELVKFYPEETSSVVFDRARNAA